MEKGYGFCRFCNHPPPMILVTEYERKETENDHPKHMGKVKIVQVYKCPKCGWMWMVSVDESTNK